MGDAVNMGIGASISDESLQAVEDVKNLLKFKLPEAMFENAKAVIASEFYDLHGVFTGFFISGSPLHSRTGAAKRSFQHKVEGNSLADFKAEVWSDSKYIPIHAKGGVIKAKDKFKWLKSGPYLAIPDEGNLTAAGVQRYSPRDVFAAKGKVILTEGKGFALAIPTSATTKTLQKKHKTAPFIITHYLRKEVTIPARLDFENPTKQSLARIISLLEPLQGL